MPENSTYAEAEVVITNPHGLHLRPIASFVEVASRFTATVQVVHGSQKVDGKSLMEMPLLGAPCGAVLRIMANGPDAKEAIAALVEILAKPVESN